MALKETEYGNDFARYGCLLDPANPAFFVKDYANRGRALAADYSMREGEDAASYWARVKHSICGA